VLSGEQIRDIELREKHKGQRKAQSREEQRAQRRAQSSEKITE
jgi:hypothetical protein